MAFIELPSDVSNVDFVMIASVFNYKSHIFSVSIEVTILLSDGHTLFA